TLIVAFLCDFCQIVSALRFQSIILNLNGFIQVMNGTGFPSAIRYHRQGSRGLKCHY
ncbi:hypothetical protein CA163_25230, partial [Vibrio parahaemolyticus]